jgi:hypothetical protein
MRGTERWKEVAKFACGLTAWEAVAHLSLLLSGRTVVLFGVALTPALNLVQTVVPAAVSLALGWWAWGHPSRAASGPGEPVTRQA